MGEKRLTLIASLATICIFVGIPQGYQQIPFVIRMFTYHLFHTNVFHLATNCIAIWFLFRNIRTRDMLVSYIIACAVYGISRTPVVGFSNILFAVMGLNTPSFSNGWWRRRETITFLAVTCLMLAVPNISAVTHIVSFILGTAVSALRRWTKKIDDTYEKANYKR